MVNLNSETSPLVYPAPRLTTPIEEDTSEKAFSERLILPTQLSVVGLVTLIFDEGGATAETHPLLFHELSCFGNLPNLFGISVLPISGPGTALNATSQHCVL